MDADYKKKYDELLQYVSSLRRAILDDLPLFQEPAWPDTIQDRKLVIRFRNAVHDAAFEKGVLSACNQILRHVGHLTDEEAG